MAPGRRGGLLRATMKGMDVGFDFRLPGAEELSRFEAGDELALVKEDDALGEIESFIEVVSDEKDGLFEAGHEGAEHVLHLGAG